MKTDPTRILALTLLAWGGLASAQAPPRLAGEWKLNRGQSDDLEAKVREAVGGGKTVGQSAEEGARVELRTTSASSTSAASTSGRAAWAASSAALPNGRASSWW
jgi:hypothetical protein